LPVSWNATRPELMNPGFLLAILTGLLWTGTGILFSRIAKIDHDFIGIRIRASLISAAAAWILYPRFPLGDPQPIQDIGRVAWVMIPGTIVGTTGMFLLNKAMGRGHNGACWTLSQSAMVIPFIAGILIWGESPSAVKLAGVACVLAAMISFGISREETPDPNRSSDSHSWFPLALVACAALGCMQIAMSIPSRWENWEDVYRIRVPILLTGMAIANLLIRCVQRPHPGNIPWTYVLTNVAIALTSQTVMFTAMDILAETGQTGLAFPVAINACVLGFSSYSLFWMREPTSKLHLAGMGLGATGIVLMTLM